jgi:hypothetical protein
MFLIGNISRLKSLKWKNVPDRCFWGCEGLCSSWSSRPGSSFRAPGLDHARAVLEDFGRFWQEETDPEPRRELLQQLFELVWGDGQKLSPSAQPPHLQIFSPASLPSRQQGVKSGSDGAQTRALHLSGIEIRIG